MLIFTPAMVHHKERKLDEAFEDIITGRGVKRSKHELFLNGRSVEPQFKEALQRLGFQSTTVDEVNVRLGERVPAFFIENSVAYFGWVFWEKFTEKKARKLWGSVLRNSKGDWAIQIPPTKRVPIYANPGQKIEMEVDRLT